DDRRRARIGHLELRVFAVDLLCDIEQIARIEADLDRAVLITHFELFDRGAILGTGSRDDEIAAIERQLHGAAALGRDRRYAIDRVGEFLAFDIEDLVVVDRYDPVVIRKGAVDQLRGQRGLADCAADLGFAERDLDLVLALLDEFSQFDHGLARYD